MENLLLSGQVVTVVMRDKAEINVMLTWCSAHSRLGRTICTDWMGKKPLYSCKWWINAFEKCCLMVNTSSIKPTIAEEHLGLAESPLLKFFLVGSQFESTSITDHSINPLPKATWFFNSGTGAGTFDGTHGSPPCWELEKMSSMSSSSTSCVFYESLPPGVGKHHGKLAKDSDIYNGKSMGFPGWSFSLPEYLNQPPLKPLAGRWSHTFGLFWHEQRDPYPHRIHVCHIW